MKIFELNFKCIMSMTNKCKPFLGLVRAAFDFCDPAVFTQTSIK